MYRSLARFSLVAGLVLSAIVGADRSGISYTQPSINIDIHPMPTPECTSSSSPASPMTGVSSEAVSVIQESLRKVDCLLTDRQRLLVRGLQLEHGRIQSPGGRREKGPYRTCDMAESMRRVR